MRKDQNDTRVDGDAQPEQPRTAASNELIRAAIERGDPVDPRVVRRYMRALLDIATSSHVWTRDQMIDCAVDALLGEE